jgi:hypothetical protein
MKKLIIPLLFAWLCLPLTAASSFSSLEEQMSGKEFTAAGLDKLTPAELAELNGWIRRHSLATLSTPTAAPAAASQAEEDPRGLKSEEKEDRTTITTRIVGPFSGWDGQTVFKLENGMIWVQADKDKFYIKEIQNPAVTIEPAMFGKWRLSIEGYGEKCKVRRIQ